LVKAATGTTLSPVVLVPLNAAVSGIVLDDDDKPVPGAWVASATSGVPVKCDPAGKFR
jgi:hypothetical protein